MGSLFLNASRAAVRTNRKEDKNRLLLEGGFREGFIRDEVKSFDGELFMGFICSAIGLG